MRATMDKLRPAVARCAAAVYVSPELASLGAHTFGACVERTNRTAHGRSTSTGVSDAIEVSPVEDVNCTALGLRAGLFV